VIDYYSSRTYYDAHLQPVWRALPPEARGEVLTPDSDLVARPRLTLVGSAGDLKKVRLAGRRAVLLNHGVGMSYGTGHFGFSGASDREGAALLLNPNWYADAADAAGNPQVPRAVVGCPKLDPWWDRPAAPSRRPIVVISFHWPGMQEMPETRWAFPHYRPALHHLKETLHRVGYEAYGHSHPLAARRLGSFWRRQRMPFLQEFDDVLRQASLYVVDNSSTAYEFAATGRPVLLMNAPWYRRDVDFGLRFWRHLPGLQVDEPEDLIARIVEALHDSEVVRSTRRAAVLEAYPVGHNGTASRLAAQAILEVMQ